MPSDGIHLKAAIVIAVVFVSLAIVHLWLGVDDEGDDSAGRGLETSTMQITTDGRQLDLGIRATLTVEEMGELIERRVAQLTSGQVSERRTSAIRLARMTNDGRERERLADLEPGVLIRLRQALLAGLNDTDEMIPGYCRDALIGLWRTPDTDAGAQLYAQGLAAYEAQQFDLASQAFDSLQKLWSDLPPDVHRMRAEIAVSRSQPDEALAECDRAIAIEPKHFIAYYVQARAYGLRGDSAQAVRALDQALAAYKGFTEAADLRRKLLAEAAPPQP